MVQNGNAKQRRSFSSKMFLIIWVEIKFLKNVMAIASNNLYNVKLFNCIFVIVVNIKYIKLNWHRVCNVYSKSVAQDLKQNHLNAWLKDKLNIVEHLSISHT